MYNIEYKTVKKYVQFLPTATSKNNLFKENVNLINILVTGNTVIDALYLVLESYVILTDSVGIQEKATSLGNPLPEIRNTTERPEAADAGTV